MTAADDTIGLRRISRHCLSKGFILPGDVRDFQGRVILRAGLIVDRHLLDAVKARCGEAFYVGPDWPSDGSEGDDPDATPAEVMHSLSLQHEDDPEDRPENRKHERHQWSVQLTLEIEELTAGGFRRRQLEVMTRNISKGGFAFVFGGYLHPDTKVSARFDTLPGKPRLTGIVRNCTLVSGRQHRIGVQFMGIGEL